LRILITGASGLLGHKIRILAQSHDHDVFGTYNLHTITGAHMKKIDLADEYAVRSLVEMVDKAR
jgi:dTDP-4-dehydrorhamnose reductase